MSYQVLFVSARFTFEFTLTFALQKDKEVYVSIYMQILIFDYKMYNLKSEKRNICDSC